MKQTFIAGPCVIESAELLDTVAAELVEINKKLGTDIIFKASFDKANRTSLKSFRGPGIDHGLLMLSDVKSKYGLRVTTDIHEAWQAQPAGQVCDILQIPAFLCRQTDLLIAAAKTGRTVNIKKGQFMAPWDMRGAISKCRDANPDAPVWLTERGSSFGYGNLVVDMTSLVRMREYGCPVIFDATHSVQQPSSQQGITGGNRELVPPLMRAALAVGIDGLFLEVHPDPDHAISDAANQVRLADIRAILTQAKAFDALAHQYSN